MDNITLTSIVVLIFLFVAIVIKVVKRKEKKPKFNIFEKEFSKKKVEVDGKINKQPLSKSRVPKEIDVIVVGSGMSGLTTAVLLAKSGKKVVVVEKMKKIGGMTHSFSKKSPSWKKKENEVTYRFAPGIHYCNGLGKGNLFGNLLQFVCDGKIKFESIGEDYDKLIVTSNKKGEQELQVSTKEKFLKDMKEKFPKEFPKIKEFVNECRNASIEITKIIALRQMPKFLRKLFIFAGYGRGYLKYANYSIEEVTKKFFPENEDLRIIFSYVYALLGSIDKLPAATIMAVFYSFLKGAYHIRNSGKIGDSLAEVLMKHDGVIFTSSGVSRILVRNKKAVGVRLENGYVMRAKQIVSAAGYYNTYSMLGTKFQPKLENYKKSESSFMVFAGFTKSRKDLKVPKQVHIIDNKDGKFFNSGFYKTRPTKKTEFKPDHLFLSFTENPKVPNHCSMTAIIMCKYEWFKKWEKLKCKQRGNEYTEYKCEVFEKQIMNMVYSIYPELSENLDYLLSGSPLTSNQYFKTNYGECYGRENSIERIFAKDASSQKIKGIKNLHLTGVDYFLMPGLVPAMLSGYLTAGMVLNQQLLLQGVEYHKQKKMKDKEGKKEK